MKRWLPALFVLGACMPLRTSALAVAPPPEHRAPTPAELLSGAFSAKSVEWRIQSFVGVKPTGESMEIEALHPASRPPVLSNLPPGFQWSAAGPPTGLDRFTFAYYLSEEQPARTAELAALRPPARPRPS